MSTEVVAGAREPSPRGFWRTAISGICNLGEESILDAGSRVSLQGILLTFTNRLRPLLVQLFLEAGEHLEKLTFGGELSLGLIGPCLWHGS